MRKPLRALLCAAALLVSLCVPAFAAPAASPAAVLPEKQGDFYLMLNGEFVTSFTDAVPQARDNRSFLPFRHTFELLGFGNIQWDQATSTASASRSDGTAVAVKLGEKALVITEDGQTRTVEADTAAYADTKLQRTFVPIGLIARALNNYKVVWDGENGVVILDDVERIADSCQETFTLMDQILEYSRTFETGKWKETGRSVVKMSQTGSAPLVPGAIRAPLEVNLSANADYTTLIQDNSAIQSFIDMDLDGTFTMNGQDVTSMLAQMSGSAFPELPASLNMEVRGDQNTGTFFFRSEGLTSLMNSLQGTKLEDTWYKIDLASLWNSVYAETGLSYSQLMTLQQSGASFEEQLPQLLLSMPVQDISFTTRDCLDAICQALGDSAFAEQNGTYVNDMSDGLDGAGSMKLVLYTASGRVSGIGMSLDLDASEDDASIRLVTDLTQKDRTTDGTMALEMTRGTGKNVMTISLSLDMDGVLSPTDETPVTEPSAGTSVLDLFETAGPDLGIIGGADGPTVSLPAF